MGTRTNKQTCDGTRYRCADEFHWNKSGVVGEIWVRWESEMQRAIGGVGERGYAGVKERTERGDPRKRSGGVRVSVFERFDEGAYFVILQRRLASHHRMHPWPSKDKAKQKPDQKATAQCGMRLTNDLRWASGMGDACKTGVCVGTSSSSMRLLLLFDVLVGTGAAVTFVALTEAEELEACDTVVEEECSSAEPPMATGCDAGLLWVKYHPTPTPPPMRIKNIMPTSHTQVERRVVPLSVFLSQALFLEPPLTSSLATMENLLQNSSPLPPAPRARSVSSELPRIISPFSLNFTAAGSLRGRAKTGWMGVCGGGSGCGVRVLGLGLPGMAPVK